MKLNEMAELIKNRNGQIAYGSESTLLQDFCEDTHQVYGMSPWDDAACSIVLSKEFEFYWIAEMEKPESLQ